MKFHQITRPETLERRYIGKMSKRAMSFLKGLLIMDPNQRFTTTDALLHPYFERLRAQDPEYANIKERVKSSVNNKISESRGPQENTNSQREFKLPTAADQGNKVTSNLTKKQQSMKDMQL